MKKHMFLLTFLLVIVFPQLLFTVFEDSPIKTETVEIETVAQVPVTKNIRVKDGNAISEMDLDTYIAGVVLGEMPADFEMEALKAQAVASRTYTLRKVVRGGKHPDADVCTDASCCQAFAHVNEYRGSTENIEKVRQAVTETAGQVVTFNDELIEATYFSCSGGKTEDAVAVWGTNVPYLKSVESPGEEGSQRYETSVTLPLRNFREKLGISGSDDLSEVEIDLTYTAGGGVDTMRIGKQLFRGTEVRKMLSLPSTAFTIEIQDDYVEITTKGNGHRVGMSQYGADAMAVSGKAYDEILSHYYPGTVLKTYTQDQIDAIFDKADNL